MMTVLATVLAVGTIAHSGTISYYGILAGVSRLCLILGLLFVGTFIAPYLVHFDGSITLGDLMYRFYGRFAQIIAGLLGCMVCLLIITAQVSAVGAMSQHLLGVPYVTTLL